MTKTDISSEICGLQFKNPLIVPSGILTKNTEYLRAFNAGVGGLVMKSCTLKPRKGHKFPRIIKWEYGVMNSVGLANPGVEREIENIKRLKKKMNIPIIASISANTVDNYAKLATKISQAGPDFIEVNISCPNMEDEFGKPFGINPKLSAKVTKMVKKNTKIPVIVKLTPNVIDIKSVAKAVEKAGADVIAAINTVGPGMKINIKTGKPILANKMGGISGPAIKPIAIRCVYDIYKSVKIPIIGMGGLTTAEDVIEMILAGASAVGVGSAIYTEGISLFRKINRGVRKYMRENNYQSIADFRGKAHEF